MKIQLHLHGYAYDEFFIVFMKKNYPVYTHILYTIGTPQECVRLVKLWKLK